ncbi:MAG: DUF3501 family protein [Chloroflexota bacterium]|nr:DUF3501 family protein [Chloroflexota bacterium]
MKPLTLADIKDIAAYERVRNAFRNQIIELKTLRRVGIGDIITLVFENRETILFQVQEMMRAERIVEDAQIQYELDTYNPLLPDAFQLSATLFIEIIDSQELRRRLPTLLGLEEHLWLRAGNTRIQAQFEEGRSTAEKLSTIHYVRFQLNSELVVAFQQGIESITLELDHPNYQFSTVLSEEIRAALALDLEDN